MENCYIFWGKKKKKKINQNSELDLLLPLKVQAHLVLQSQALWNNLQ